MTIYFLNARFWVKLDMIDGLSHKFNVHTLRSMATDKTLKREREKMDKAVEAFLMDMKTRYPTLDVSHTLKIVEIQRP